MSYYKTTSLFKISKYSHNLILYINMDLYLSKNNLHFKLQNMTSVLTIKS